MTDTTAATRRAERLAAALRANLQRRKGRDREAAVPPPAKDDAAKS